MDMFIDSKEFSVWYLLGVNNVFKRESVGWGWRASFYSCVFKVVC